MVVVVIGLDLSNKVVMMCSRGDNRYLFNFLMVAGICKIYTTFMTKALATSSISCILQSL